MNKDLFWAYSAQPERNCIDNKINIDICGDMHSFYVSSIKQLCKCTQNNKITYWVCFFETGYYTEVTKEFYTELKKAFETQ